MGVSGLVGVGEWGVGGMVVGKGEWGVRGMVVEGIVVGEWADEGNGGELHGVGEEKWGGERR